MPVSGDWRAGIDDTASCPLPQGAEAVERLNESGELRRMLKPFKVGDRWRRVERLTSISSVDLFTTGDGFH